MAKRVSYSTLPEHLRDCSLWPLADFTHLNDEDRARVEAFVAGIRHYLNTGELKAACALAQCSKSSLYSQLARCTQPDPIGQSVVGWVALIPYRRVGRYQRKASASGTRESGFAGAFQQFLELHPHIWEKLISLVRTGGGPKGVKSAAPSKKGVYRAFENYCLSSDGSLTEKDYPFNTTNRGRRAVERFIDRSMMRDAKARTTWFGPEVAQQVQLGTGIQSFRYSSVPFETVASDTHSAHCIGTILIEGPAGPQPVVINRILFHPFVDECTGVIISYAASFNAVPNSNLIEEAMVGFSKKWEPRSISLEGFKYPPNAMLPVGNINSLDEIRPCILKFDNAAAHYSKKITLFARRYLGAAVTFGPIRGWSWNAFCERLFLNFSRFGIQQLQSSTGANTADPLRPDFIENAIRYRITWQTILDIIDICAATYNSTPSAGLGGISPLVALQNHIQFGMFIPRPAAPLGPLAPRIGLAIEVKSIAGRAKKGAFRTPYVQVDKAHYGGECIAKRFDLIGTKVVAHIDESKMRRITIFSLEGDLIGDLVCLDRRWSQQEHTRATRREINKMIARGEMQMSVGDYIMEYMSLHYKQARKDAQQNPKKKSQAATKLAETLRATGLDAPPPLPNQVGPRAMRRPVPGFVRRPTWGKE